MAFAQAKDLVTEGVFSSVSQKDEPGEASCLTLMVPGEAKAFYVQPMYPDLEDEEERYVELYVERDHPHWNPFPFQVSRKVDTSFDIDLMLRTIGAWSSLVKR